MAKNTFSIRRTAGVTSFIFTAILLFIFNNNSIAQISEGGRPASFDRSMSNAIPVAEMAYVDVQNLLAEDAAEDNKALPFRFGYDMDVNLDMNNSGVWEDLPDGRRVWRLKIKSEGAYSINLMFDWFWLPEGAKFYVYSENKAHVIGAFSHRNNKEHGGFSTAPVYGDVSVLEYIEPANSSENGIISVSKVIHGYKDIFKKFETDAFGSSGSCNNNVNCPEGDDWNNEKRSVAMILLASNTRWCSGSMVNNANQDQRQLFLTANHCLNGGEDNFIIMFKYESPTCDNIDGPTNYTVQGTTTLAKNSASDFALLEITEAIPDSFRVHYAGWTSLNEASPNSVGIHHPAGDIKKISFDNDPAVTSDYDPSPYLADSHWEVTAWDDGTTEGGSSGSPLFDPNHRIVGQLHGGWASCSSITQDYYGKFSMSWDYGTTPETRLKDWLDPNNTGITVLNGWDPTIGDPDAVPPTPIVDLMVTDSTSYSLKLAWTAPYDTSFNGVTSYDIRYSTSPITDSATFYAATQAAFAGSPADSGLSESVTVVGLEFATEYNFAIIASDIWGNLSDMSNVVSGATYGAPEISVTPDSLGLELNQQAVYVDTVFVSNISVGNSNLDFSVSMENNTFPEGKVSAKILPVRISSEAKIEDKENPKDIGGLSLKGFGGPDAFGYQWIDSDETNGPVYVWNDISTTGTEITSWTATGTFDPKDEGNSEPLDLGFNFKFYGNVYNQVTVNSNGPLVFSSFSGNIFSNDPIPDAGDPNNFIAAFWDDMEGTDQGEVYFQQIGNTFVVQFNNWADYNTTNGNTFQIVLKSNGQIFVYYNNMTGDLSSATVGIENADGTDGLQIDNNGSYAADGKAVKIAAEPEWVTSNVSSGSLTNGNTAAVELSFASEDYVPGNYSMDLKVTSNDPVTSEIIVPLTLEILVVPVELTSFEASTVNGTVSLHWITATETNNSGFEIQRKDDNSSWQQVGYIDGKGNSTTESSYSFNDNLTDKNIAGALLYRLKQIDFDGSVNYSNTIEIDLTNVPVNYSLEQNYPNPFNPTTTIKYALPEASNVKITLYNVLGQAVKTILNSSVTEGYHSVRLDASDLSSGVYVYSIEAKGLNTKSNFFDIKKLILMK